MQNMWSLEKLLSIWNRENSILKDLEMCVDFLSTNFLDE